jgi:hypothetical protein
MAPEAPAVAVAGKTAAMVGAGGVDVEIVKGTELERIPELDTSICTDPEDAISDVGRTAVSCVALTKVVANVDGRAGGGFTTHLTAEPLTKFVPVTVRVTFEVLHDGVVLFDVADEETEVTVGPVIVNEMAQFVTHFGAPCVSTPTCAVPVARRSDGGTVAVSCVALLKTVGSEVTTLLRLVHCTTEQGRILDPVTVKVNAELPAPAVVCESELSTGVARPELEVVSVTGEEVEVPTELATVTLAVPGNAAAVAGIAAVSLVALTKVVGSGEPFQFTTASLVKFVPFTVSVKPCVLQAGVEAVEVVDAETEVMAGGVPGGAPIVKRTRFEISVVVVLLMFEVADCAEPGICTAICTVPAVVRREAGTGAVS